jgi:hypothetical protein
MKFITISPSLLVFSDIINSEFSARQLPKETDKDYNTFLELKESIATSGLLNTFSVYAKEDKFCVIDGNRRAYAIVQLFNEKNPSFAEKYPDGITVQLMETDDTNALINQIAGNYHVNKQKAASLAKACYKVLIQKTMTISELSKKLNISAQYLEQILKINALPDTIKSEIDAGQITATNAIQLCKIPAELLDADIVGQSKLLAGPEFTAYADNLVKEYKKAIRENRDPNQVDGTVVFSATPKLRMKQELEAMYITATERFVVEPSDYNKGFADALKYSFRMDESTLEDDRRAFDLAQKEKAEKKELRKRDREIKKTEEMLEFAKSNPAIVDAIKKM